MSCCCTKVYKFCGPVDSCDADEFGAMFKDLSSADYTVELEFLDALIEIPITVNDHVVDISPLDLNKLNEGYTYTGKVINADGEVVPLIVDTIEYDCFQFTTKFKI